MCSVWQAKGNQDTEGQKLLSIEDEAEFPATAIPKIFITPLTSLHQDMAHGI